jgi:peptidase YpeB-like protein
MIPVLLAAGAAISGGASDFKTAFPAASVITSADGARITHASGFEAEGLGDTPEAAARKFLARHGAAFGIGPRQQVVARDHPSPGQAVAVHFERRVGRAPVFDGDLVVGVNAKNAVVLVNAADIPARVAGRPRISRDSAIRAAKRAIRGLELSSAPRAERGWGATGNVIRPVWRVDFTATRPKGDWRTFVDAETGRVLVRADLRTTAQPPGIVPNRALDLHPQGR